MCFDKRLLTTFYLLFFQFSFNFSPSEQGKNNPGDVKWMQTVAQGGTLSDKLAAATVMLQDSPLHRMDSLKMLVGIVVFGARNRLSTEWMR